MSMLASFAFPLLLLAPSAHMCATRTNTTCCNFLQPAGGFEEYFDYIFPDEQAGQGNVKLLQMAHMWKQKLAEQQQQQQGPTESAQTDSE